MWGRQTGASGLHAAHLVDPSAHIHDCPRHRGLPVSRCGRHLDSDVIAASCLPVAKPVAGKDLEGGRDTCSSPAQSLSLTGGPFRAEIRRLQHAHTLSAPADPALNSHAAFHAAAMSRQIDTQSAAQDVQS